MDPKKRNYQWTLGHVWVCRRTAHRVCNWCRFHPATQADGILPGDSRYLRLRAKHVLSDCVADIFAVSNWAFVIICGLKNRCVLLRRCLLQRNCWLGQSGTWSSYLSWAANDFLTMSSTSMHQGSIVCCPTFERELCLCFTSTACSVQCTVGGAVTFARLVDTKSILWLSIYSCIAWLMLIRVDPCVIFKSNDATYVRNTQISMHPSCWFHLQTLVDYKLC